MNAAVALLAQAQPWHWLALALILLVAEIATGTSYLLWPAAAAALVAVGSFLAPGLSWPVELAAFAGLTIALTLTGRRYVRGRWLSQTEGGDGLNERGAQLIGQTALVEAAFVGGVGRVRLGDTTWRATGAEAFAAGEEVAVAGVDGATLKVARRA